MSARGFSGTVLAVALLLAGVVSLFASGHPDGLEHVAGTHDFLHVARDSLTAGSPLADYAVSGIDVPALSGGLAGVVGALLTFALVALVLRPRRA